MTTQTTPRSTPGWERMRHTDLLTGRHRDQALPGLLVEFIVDMQIIIKELVVLLVDILETLTLDTIQDDHITTTLQVEEFLLKTVVKSSENELYGHHLVYKRSTIPKRSLRGLVIVIFLQFVISST